MKAIHTFLSKTPASALAVIVFGLLGLVGLADHATAQGFSFSIFYLIPIAIAAWFGTAKLGLLVAILAGLTWLLVDHLSGRPYPHPAMPIWNTAVRQGFFLIIAYLLARVRSNLRREEDLADTDPLTGVKNTRVFYEEAEAELARLRRYGRPFSVAYLDLDNFKKLNDTRGHVTGDELLVRVARTMRENTRQTDTVARLGGDEFAILMPETGTEGCRESIGKIRALLKEEMAGRNWPVSFSIGVVTFEVAPSDARELVKIADDLMYLVKKSGKNDVRHETWIGA